MKRNAKLKWQESPFETPPLEQVHQSLANALREQAELRPEAPALLWQGSAFSFGALAARAWILAEEIKAACPEYGPIGLVQSAGVDAVAAWFACSLAQRPFLLLEPDHPPKRLYELVEKAGCVLVVGDASTAHLRYRLGAMPFLVPSTLGEDAELLSANQWTIADQWTGMDPDEPACIFPTSGSTGEPKLVVYASSTLQAKVQASRQLMQVAEGDRVVIAGSHSNYGFLHHALVFLLSGGAVCLVDIKNNGFDPLTRAISEDGARHARFTPTLFRKVAAMPKLKPALKLLEAVRFSGEPLLANDLERAKEVLAPQCLIQNVYGSTESALFIWTTSAKDAPLSHATAPIGHIYPFSSYAISPNDSNDPDSGELIIRSPYQALGDYFQGQIDVSRFPKADTRTKDHLYFTGDVVRRLPDGNLLHLGRLGRMAKVRGNRVSLAEVEEGIKRFAGVSEVGVVEVDFGSGSELYAFVTPSSSAVSSDDVLKHLQAILPSYMWPKGIETLDSMPALPGGKIDYRELVRRVPSPKPYRETDRCKEKDAFKTLCEMWDSVLGDGAHKEPGDFLALGGDSLDLMELGVRIEEEFDRDIPLEVFRINSSLQHLAALLDIRPTPGFQIIPYEQLHAKLLWPSKGERKGIVLAVPSIGGWATAAPFKHAGWFPDYDLWAASYPFEHGDLTQELRAWKVANRLAEAIHDGTIPKPNVLLGYSFGGGLAWVLARLLKSEFSPEHIILVDAAPLHRLAHERYALFHKTVQEMSGKQVPHAIHICRAALKNPIVQPFKKSDWVADEDTISKEVSLPTVDHLEMIRPELLALAREQVNLFLESERKSTQPAMDDGCLKSNVAPPPREPAISESPEAEGAHSRGAEAEADLHAPSEPAIPELPDLPGVVVFRAIHGERFCIPQALAHAFNPSNSLNADQFLSLFGVLYVEGDRGGSSELLDISAEKWPHSKPLQFVRRRMWRAPHFLYNQMLPALFPEYIRQAERFLGTNRATMELRQPVWRRAILLVMDVALSQLHAKRGIKPKS